MYASEGFPAGSGLVPLDVAAGLKEPELRDRPEVRFVGIDGLRLAISKVNTGSELVKA